MDNPHIFLLHWEAQYPFEQVRQALTAWKPPEEISKGNIYVALPQGYLQQASKELASLGFSLGANDMADASRESFTGPIASKLLQKSQAKFVLIGSAFKRRKMEETTVSLRHKVQAALANDIIPFLCFCTEYSEPRNTKPFEAIKKELKDVLEGLSSEELQRIRFVYDNAPEQSSTSHVQPETLQEAYNACRQVYAELCGDEAAGNIKTLCAFPPYYSLSKIFTEKSPFSGFYFKMTDTHLPTL